MITEDYVSFETAKLLKEKGFDIPLLTFYITDKEKKEGDFQTMAFTDDKIDNNHSDICYLAPTLQMAMKWLREVHGLYITIYHRFSHNADNDVCFGFYINVDLESNGEWFTYEEAVEAALKYALKNLI